jgi:hypothetical protein
MLQRGHTRQSTEEYKNKRREEKEVHRKKQREYENLRMKEIKECRNRNESRIFCRIINRD